MKKIMLTVAMVALAVCLSACASFDARLKVAADIHTATTTSVTNALDAHLISSRDAEAYREIAHQSSFILDSAKALKDTDVDSAEAKLDLANKILGELHKYLLRQEQQR